MTGRFYSVFFSFFLMGLLAAPAPAAFALDADPVLLNAPDKKPFVMTVMGVRKAFPVANDTIRLEVGIASNTSPLKSTEAFRIVSEDDPGYAYEKFVQPESVSFPADHLVTELTVPDGFRSDSKAADIFEFKRETVDVHLRAPMQAGKTYSVVVHGTGSDVVSGGKTAAGFRYDPADIPKAPAVRHDPDLMTLTALGLRGLDSVGNGIIRLEFGPSFFCKEGYLLRHYHVTVNGEPVTLTAMGRRSQIDLYRPYGWPFNVVLQHEVFLQLDCVLAEGDRLRVEVDPAVVSGANAAEMTFSGRTSFSSAVKVNQVGYITTAVKTAKLGRWMGSFPDTKAVLATVSEEQFRDISVEEVLFGESRFNLRSGDGKENARNDKEPEKKETGEKNSIGTASVADYEFSSSSLKYDTPPPFEIRDARTHEIVFTLKSSELT